MRADIDAAFAKARAEAAAELAQLRVVPRALPEWPAVSPAEKASIEAAFDAAAQPIRTASVIGLVKARVNEFRSREFPKLLERAAKAGAPAAGGPLGKTRPKRSLPRRQDPTKAPPVAPDLPPRFVSVAQLPVHFAKAALDDEADVADYFENSAR